MGLDQSVRGRGERERERVEIASSVERDHDGWRSRSTRTAREDAWEK